MADYYELLGLQQGAAAAEIRSAYLRLARERHPDRFTDPEQRREAELAFQQITEAFNMLSNERSRAAYDAERARPRPSSPAEQAQAAFEQAQAAAQAANWQAALEGLKAAVHHVPTDARYRLALGRLLVRAKDPRAVRDGIQHLEEATRLAPREAGAFCDLALALHAQGLSLRARRALAAGLAANPQDTQLLRLAAEIGSGGEADGERGKGGGGLGGLLRRKR